MWIYEYLQYFSFLPIILVFLDLKKSPYKFIIYVCVFGLTIVGLSFYIQDFLLEEDWYYFLPLMLAPFIAAILPSFNLNFLEPVEQEDSEVIDKK